MAVRKKRREKLALKELQPTLPTLLLVLGLFALPCAASAQESGGFNKANLDLPFDAGGTNEEEEEAPDIVIFYGQQYEGDGIFFSCDRSGSMREGGKFKRLQNEVIKNISSFSEKVQFGVVFFAGDLTKFPNSGKPAVATPAMKAAAISMVNSAAFGRGTCTKIALQACMSYAQLSSAKRKIIIHLSDGLHRCNGADPNTYGNETLSEVRQKNTSGIRVNSICIGPPGAVDENWMRRLASENNGTYARIVQ